jgi:ADP-ribose pyrophosphatase YjhB (NUDIX family)
MVRRVSIFHPIYRGVHFLRRLKSGHTIGVRAVISDERNGLFLVRHSYVPGWYFPGGAVEPGETVVEALGRELDEEAGLRPVGEPELAGVFLNRKLAGRDHVLLFRVPAVEALREFTPNLEVLEARFFSLTALPDNLSKGTRRRVDELFNGAPVSRDW